MTDVDEWTDVDACLCECEYAFSQTKHFQYALENHFSGFIVDTKIEGSHLF